ncbi:peptidase S8/S53 domain-containing protein [Lactarius quietus]|nr:peptidase S8/S53 domain-containing protein [Lactarius quietus]
MRYQWLSVLSVLSTVTLSRLAMPPAPLWGDMRVKHTWDTIPNNWESLGPPPTGTTIDLYIALRPHREDALIDALHEEEVAELVAPHRDTVEIVHSWLKHHGVPSSSILRSHGGGWLTVTAVPVSQADELLCASYQVYRHTGMNNTEAILRTVSYSLPEALHMHVQTVAPTTLFASLRTPLLQTPHKRSSKEAPAMGNTTAGKLLGIPSTSNNDPIATPEFLRWLYRTEAYQPTATAENKVGILGLQNEYPSPTDLKKFMAYFRADAMDANFTVVQLNGGGYDPSRPGEEANLDVQYASAMAYPVQQVFYSTGGILLWSTKDGLPSQGDSYLEWLFHLFHQSNIPATLSISYGNPEPQIPPEYAGVMCLLFAQLGVRGVSVLAASGDYGVGSGTCVDKSGRILFLPMFPASCPWVTSVGGTKNHNPEISWPLSGGGFSYYFSRPNYQDAMAVPYLKSLGNEYDGLYHPYGRGIPDIAAQSNQLAVIVNNALSMGSGHPSWSTRPMSDVQIAAGIVSLLNDYRISTGKPPLGFLNLWLYGHGLAGINDILSGNNPGCNTKGFNADVGWDPVTGLGTLDFERLLRLLVSYNSA